MANAYRFVRNEREPFDSTESIVAARDDDGNVTKTLLLGGDSVELTDEERERIPDYLVLESAAGAQQDKTADASDSASQSGTPAPTGGGAARVDTAKTGR